MRTTVGRWGNSLAIRLPRHVVEEARLVDGATVAVEIEDGSIRITPLRRRYKLEELLKGEKPRNAAEFDWGKPTGEEVW